MDAKISWYVVFFLLADITFALTTYSETATVSRIVGESPTEMMRQLQRSDLKPDDATYFTYDPDKKAKILKKQFGNNMDYEYYGWNFVGVEEAVEAFDRNELFIIESHGRAQEAYNMLSSIEPKDVVYWQLSFEKNNPLFLFDAPYGGSYLPKQDTFVARLVRDSTIVSPMSFNSPQFTKSFLCQLDDGKTVGEVYRDARNFHYNEGSESDRQNNIGLVLQSYTLYGNPLQEIGMDWNDPYSIKKYCANLHENLATGIDYIGEEGNFSKFRKHILFNINEYNIDEFGNYSLINASDTWQEYGDLVLPVALRTTHFPASTLILNYSLDFAGGAVLLNVSKLPSYNAGLVERTCTGEKNYSVTFYDAYTKSDHDFLARISPVQSINCSEGLFLLYTQFNYSIDYVPLSPVVISKVYAPSTAPAGSAVNVSIKIVEIMHNHSNGTITIFDEQGIKLFESDAASGIVNASFYAPSDEGFMLYSAEIIYDNLTTHYKEFGIISLILEPRVSIPATTGGNPALSINFFSYYNKTFELKADYYLLTNNSLLQPGNFTQTINTGDNERTISFLGLTKQDQMYELILELTYLNQKKMQNYLLNTNNAPGLITDYRGVYDEGDKISINYTVFDIDGDSMSVNINDSRFLSENGSFVWQTGYNDSGNYSISIVVSDGYIETSELLDMQIYDETAPAVFRGNMRYENGTPAEGMNIHALINGTLVAFGSMQGSSYDLIVPGDDMSTSTKDGGTFGDVISIMASGYDVMEEFFWEEGLSRNADLMIINPCQNVTCEGHCLGDRFYHSGVCYFGVCSYQVEENWSDCNCQGQWNVSGWDGCSVDDRQYSNWTNTDGCGRPFMDYNRDWVLNESDMSFIQGCFNRTGEECQKSDLNADCNVDIEDMIRFEREKDNPAFIPLACNVCNYCSPAWVNINSSCHPDATFIIGYTYTNSCCHESGLESDCTIPDNASAWCDYCTPDMQTAYLKWIDLGCLASDVMNQSREKITYDANDCGEVANFTSIEYRATEYCDYCTPNMVNRTYSWENFSCLPSNVMNHSRKTITYDKSACNEIPNSTTYEYMAFDYCDYCTPNMTNTWSAWINTSHCTTWDVYSQSRNRIEYDSNYCSEVYNKTYYESRNQSCDYCTSTWYSYNTSCNSDGDYWVRHDYNDTCCAETGLSTDCNKPEDYILSCIYEFNISLEKGWNLLSIPIKSDSLWKI